jgi:hypothetical protein
LYFRIAGLRRVDQFCINKRLSYSYVCAFENRQRLAPVLFFFFYVVLYHFLNYSKGRQVYMCLLFFWSMVKLWISKSGVIRWRITESPFETTDDTNTCERCSKEVWAVCCVRRSLSFFHEKWKLFEFHSVTVMRNNCSDTVGTFCVIRVLKLKKNVVFNVCHKKVQDSYTKGGRRNSTYYTEFPDDLFVKKEVSSI